MAVFLLIPFIMGAVFAFIGYSLAKNKGHDGTVWAIICFLFGVFGLIILAVLPSKNQPRGGYYGSRRTGRDYDRRPGRRPARPGSRPRPGAGGSRSSSNRAASGTRRPARRPRRR